MRAPFSRRVGVGMLAAAVLGAAVLVGALRLRSEEGASAAAAASAAPNPVRTGDGGVGNVTLYYHGKTKLAPGADLSDLGNPTVVVATGTGEEAQQIAAIHSIGAKAYRYVQYYWAPQGRPYEGVNFTQLPGWKFCRSGDTGLIGRTVGSERWYFIDTNEIAVRNRIRDALVAIRARGWDGVMFDRGAAATQAVLDTRGRRNWFRRSTCTHDPYRSRATFSDAYMHMVGMARGVGLGTMMNNGRSPFDPSLPMRPDPSDKQCREALWSYCRKVDDAWPRLDLVLNERAARPRAQDWRSTFTGNRRSERNTSYGRRTVGVITTASLGGVRHQRPPAVFYQWARIKLFDLPVAVNTGDDGCDGAPDGSVCNRYGLYPALTSIRFGAPLTSLPASGNCVGTSDVRCTWLRRYAAGMSVVNVTDEQRTARLPLGLNECRYVYDVFHQTPLNANRCVTRVRLDLPAWSGRPLLYATKPW